MSVTQAVILAAGEGQRMRPLTSSRPKGMLPIANRPILEHLLIEMKLAGIQHFYLVVGYHDEQIRSYFGDGSLWSVKIDYLDQRQQSGTADALRMAGEYIQGAFMAANGDNVVYRRDILNVMESTETTLGVIELAGVSHLGVVEVENDRVTQLHEKSAAPPSHMANAGLYFFTPEIFAAIAATPQSPRGEYELTDSLKILIESGKKVYFKTMNQWLECSYPWDLLNANEQVLSTLEPQNDGEIEPNVTVKGILSLGKASIIRSGTYIIGPVMIGRNCDIGPNAFLRPGTVIGDNCRIGAAVEIKNSIIMAGSRVPHLNYVGDSIIGENCNLGAGTKIANLKLNKQNIYVNDMDTGRTKLGAIIGDNVQTGINASINVGTLIGDNSLIGPGALAQGSIAPGSRVF